MNFKKDYPELYEYVNGKDFETLRALLSVNFAVSGQDAYVTDADIISFITAAKMRDEGASQEEINAFNDGQFERYKEERQ